MTRRKTKILATVGPASDSYETLLSMIEAGVNVFRLNFSHGTHEYHANTLQKIRKAIDASGKLISILQDISGPKIRIGELPYPMEVKEGDTIIFDKQADACSLSKKEIVLNLNRPEILKKVAVGDAIYLYDGKIQTTVTHIEKERVIAVVDNHGILSSNKGVNFPKTHLGIDVLTEKDRADILWGIENDVDFMAISFVQDADDMINVRRFIQENNGDVRLFAKIEKFDAVANIDEIIDASDGIMVARGDLGIEMPYSQVPIIQKEIITKANEAGKPVITATQMLLSMTENEIATRAEISDVANAVLDGTDAVMLSEESAVGINPPKAVATMAQTIMDAETIYPYGKNECFIQRDETDTIALSMTRLAQDLNVEGIIALTSSGGSAMKMARYRAKPPIYSVSHDDKTARALTIVWGVYPRACVQMDFMHNMLGAVLREMIASNRLDLHKTYLAVAGYPAGVPGTTNFMRMLKKAEIEHYTETTY